MKCYAEDPTRHATLLELEKELPKEMTCIRRHFWKRTTLRKKWKTIRPRPTEFDTNWQLMLLKIMENVRRVVVLGSKTAEVILSRVAVLESEIAKVIFATAVVVKFRITIPDPSAWSFAENVISAAEMELKARLLML